MTIDENVASRLRVVGDVLMPRHGVFPSFTEADPDGAVLGAALHELRRDLPMLMSVIAALGGCDSADAESGQLDQRLMEVRATNPGGFEMLRVLIVGAYLSCRSVWDALGYPGRVDNPVRDDEAKQWLDIPGSDSADALLEPVRQRGPIFRPTPPG